MPGLLSENNKTHVILYISSYIVLRTSCQPAPSIFIVPVNRMYRSAGYTSEGRVVQGRPVQLVWFVRLPCSNSAWYFERRTNLLSTYHLKNIEFVFPSLFAFLSSQSIIYHRHNPHHHTCCTILMGIMTRS